LSETFLFLFLFEVAWGTGGTLSSSLSCIH